ncbi:unnamed protein product, partial [Laminaria digitata]
MVNVVTKRCARDPCAEWPSFNFEGQKTPAFCKKHSEDGMVNVFHSCARGCCETAPNINFHGSKRPAFCKRHAEDGMV